MNWWATLFDKPYYRPTFDLIGPNRVESEAAFIAQRLAIRAGDHVLDVACGLGRHVLALSNAGALCIGLDLSLPLLAEARDISQDSKGSPHFVRGDMRRLPFIKDAFSAITCISTSFGYFDEERDNLRVLEEAFRCLRPGGAFFLHTDDRSWWEGRTCLHKKTRRRQEFQWSVAEESRYDMQSHRVFTTAIYISGNESETTQWDYRVYYARELAALLRNVGFTGTCTSGSFSERRATADVKRFCVWARKPT